MAYVNKIATKDGTKAIGGAQFDDEWVYKQTTIISTTTIAAGATTTYSLSSYLPNDGHDYMVLLMFYLETGATSGNCIDAQVYSGSSASGFSRRVARCLTRTSSKQLSASTIEIPIKASDRAFTVKNGDGSGNGTHQIYTSAYRKLGTNGNSSNYIEKIKTPNEEITVGGPILDGQPVSKGVTLLSSVSIAASGTSTVSLASHLPNDGYDYLCYFNLTNNTPATNGAANTLRLCPGTTTSPSISVCRVVARSAATRCCAGNLELKISASNKNITVYNSGGSATNTTTLYLRGYRRLGTNRASTSNQIANINNVPFGGNIADKPWTYKYLAIFNAVAFADQASADKTYTITNYLPKNNRLYEVLFYSYSRTGTTSGDMCSYWVNGNGVSCPQVGSYVNTRTKSNECDAKSGVLFLKQNSSGQATISVDMTSSQATGNCGLYICGYREIGLNT